MNQKYILSAAEVFARRELEHDRSGHDWWHADRTRSLARKLAESEGADQFICELAALLHDVADEKLNDSEEAGLRKVREWLESQGVPAEVAGQVLEILATISFKGGHRPPMRTLEGRVVQDADRLDALGAIGIARVFAYSGAHGRPIHEPARAPREAMSPEEYRSGNDTAINHFHEKLLKLKDRMNTRVGREIAAERHRVMEEFLERFGKEWQGLA